MPCTKYAPIGVHTDDCANCFEPMLKHCISFPSPLEMRPPIFQGEVKANDRQVGGNHYKNKSKSGLQHWDLVEDFDLDYFQGQITKYVMRWRDKDGVEALEKARHFLDKYIEIQKRPKPTLYTGYDVLKVERSDVLSPSEYAFREGPVEIEPEVPECPEMDGEPVDPGREAGKDYF